MKKKFNKKFCVYGGMNMNNKLIGVIFCCISAILMCTRYLSVAIFMSGASIWDEQLLSAVKSEVVPPLFLASFVALIVGILFLAYGLYQEFKKDK